LESKGAVEAALFAASGGLRVRDIAELTGLSDSTVRSSLKELAAEYEERGSAIRILKIGPEYLMQLREEYARYSEKFSRMEISPALMKTLSTIAYNQPALQSDLFRARGSRAYDDVRELIEMDLVHGKPKGQTLELTTTRKFAEYFGIEGGRPEDVRRWIEENERK